MSEITSIYNAYNLKFIFTIDTRNVQNGSTNSDQYKLPLISTGTYDFVVDWGDGTTDTITQYDQAEATHTYETEGIYEIQIDGKCERVKFGTIPNNTGETLKVLDVKQWGCAKLWLNDYGTPFSNCKNVIMSATDTPQFQETSNYSKIFKQQAFQFCENLTGDFSGWGTEESPLGGSWYVLFQYSYNADVNVSWVGSTSSVQGTFNSNYNFNGDLSRWNVQSVPDLLQTFGRTSFNNDSIKDWNISNVTSMRGTFGNTPFNQDIASWENWDVSNVNSMWATFYQSQFNRDIGSWNVSNVTDFRSMFQNSRSLPRPHFNNGGSPSISGWTLTTDPTKSINMSGMFYENLDFNQPIGSWDTSRVTNMSQMFYNRFSFQVGGAAFDQDISTWDVSNVTTFYRMFMGHRGMSDENYSKLSSWNVTSACTDMVEMFSQIGTDKLTTFNPIGWDVSNVTNMTSAFYDTGISSGATNMIDWDTSSVTSMSQMFRLSSNFNLDISGWDVSNVTSMAGMFDNSGMSTENYSNTLIGWAAQAPNIQTGVTLGASTIQYGSFAEEARDLLTGTYGWTIVDSGLYTIPAPTTDLSNYFDDGTDPSGDPIPEDIIFWETSGVTTMYRTFYNASDFNLNIGGWDTSNVTNLQDMFRSTSFNQDISNWNTSSVTNMNGLFENNTIFNQDIGGWDMSNVTTAFSMFRNASSFNQDISNWDVSSLYTLKWFFDGVSSFNQDIGNWNISNVSNMDYTFRGATLFDQDLGSWDVSKVKNMYSTFENSGFNNGGSSSISGWTTSGVTNMSNLFRNTPFNQPIGSWDMSSVENIGLMFQNTPFNQPLSGWNVSNVLYMTFMFQNSSFNQDISQWDVSNVIQMDYMFQNNPQFNQDISGWDTSNVKGMSQMFYKATSFNQPIGTWNVSGVTNMLRLFRESNFNQDITNWDTSNVTNMSEMFYLNPSFNQNLSGWTISGVTNMYVMFYGSGMSIENYSNTLIGWAAQAPNIQTGVTLGAGTIQYGSFAEEARDLLTGTYGWTITDGGLYSIPAPTTNLSQYFIDGTDPSGDPIPEDIIYWETSGVTRMDYTFSNATDFDLNIGGWDTSNVSNMTFMFNNTSFNNAGSNLIGNWDTSNVTSMSYMFQSSSFNNPSINAWDVSNVTSMFQMFRYSDFNQPLSGWNVSSVISMSRMFTDTQFNQDIGNWDMSNVIDLNGIFQTTPFNNGGSDSINNWNLSAVTTMQDMFRVNTSFNQPIGNWILGNVTNMSGMFFGANSFDQDISNWDVSTVTNMGAMFYGATSFDNLGNNDIGNWDVSNVTSFSVMFWSQGKFNRNIGAWRFSNTENINMTRMFAGCTLFDNDGSDSISGWNVNNVTLMTGMFQSCNFNRNISSWDTSSCTKMDNMFYAARYFNKYLGDWDVSNVTNFSGMFHQAGNWSSDPVDWGVRNWNTSSATYMNNMFSNLAHFNEDISGWDVSNVINFGNMFGNSSIFNQDLSTWDVSSATNMITMFRSTSFNQNLGNWIISGVTNMSDMFSYSDMSTENYSDTLIGWAAQAPNIQTGVTLSAVGIKYNAYATEARNLLTSVYDWTITDASIDEDIVMDGLVFSVDAGNTSSYPGSGTTWVDLVGDSDGTLINGPTFDSNNRGSIVFDGSNDYVLISPSFPEADNAPYTYCVMVFIDQSTGTNQYIVGNGAHSRSEGGSILLYDPSGQQLMRFTSQYDNYNGEVDFQINYGEWLYVVGTNDGLNSINSVKLYINSELKGQTTPTSFTNDPQIPNLTIGTADNVNGGLGLNGKISFVQIYNRALSEAEILQNYNAQKGRFGL